MTTEQYADAKLLKQWRKERKELKKAAAKCAKGGK